MRERRLAGASATHAARSRRRSELDLLRQAQRIVDFDPEVTDGALNLRKYEKQLDRSQVAGLAVDRSAPPWCAAWSGCHRHYCPSPVAAFLAARARVRRGFRWHRRRPADPGQRATLCGRFAVAGRTPFGRPRRQARRSMFRLRKTSWPAQQTLAQFHRYNAASPCGARADRPGAYYRARSRRDARLRR